LKVMRWVWLALLWPWLTGVWAAGSTGDWTEWRVRSLRCMGLQRTDSLVILREVELKPGVGYNDRMLAEDAQAVKNTNLFARLIVSVSPDSAEEAVDLVYAVSERPRWLAYPIVTPTEKLGWIYGFGLMNRNMGGLGRRLDLEAEYGEHLSYSFYLQEPWFLGRRQPLSLYISRRSAESAEGDYRRLSKEVRFSWQHHFDRETKVGLHPFWTELRVRDHRAQPEQVTVSPRDLDVYGGLGVSVERNTTDFHVNPSRGGVVGASLNAFGLAGQDHPAGTQFMAGATRFQPLTSVLTAGLNVTAGMSVGRRADYMKHYLGGRTRVRSGYGDQWPGWSHVRASLEVRAPILQRRVYFQHIDFGLGMVAFVDGGVVWQDQYHGSRVAAGGAGLGLRLFAPFVEVGRIDVAWSPEHGAVIHFGQGHAF